MQELIEKFCGDVKLDNGLLLIDMPTGMGKTYSVTKYIAENYEKIKGKIFFITQLKKNLPEDDLRKQFKEIGKLEEFEKLFLRVENNVNNLCENFHAVKSDLLRFIPDKQLIYKIDREVQLINRKDNLSEDDWLLVQQARDDLSEISEKKLRDLVIEYLRYDSDGKERTRQERKRLISEDKAYRWIGTLYPTALSDDKKIFLMSLDKFLLRYSTIIEPSFYLYENNQYLAKGVIFIDEFDTTKDVVLNRIIQNGLYNKVGIINIFRVIYSGLFDTDFTKILTEQSHQYSDKKYKPIIDIIHIFQSMAKDIMDNHRLNFLHKLQEEYKNDISFLFQDYKLHTIVNGENKCIIVDADKSQSVNWLKVEGYKDSEESNSIYQLIGDIIKFLGYFQTGVGFIADNYLALKRERKQGDYNITPESAIRTTLAEFGVYGTMQNYLTYNIMLSKKGGRADYRISDALDSTVYEKGFRYYHILDNDNYDTQSRINYVAFNDSPEKFLIRLMERTKVVGISASAKLPTVLGNYDLEYIKKVRHDLIFEPSIEDENRLRDEFEKSIAHHKNVHIHCDPVGFEEGLSDIAKKVYQEINSKSNFEDYKQDRFLCFAEAVDRFFKEKHIKSLLYFANSKGREYEIEGQNYLKNYFEELRSCYGSYAEMYFLNGSNDVFERRKDKALQALKEGKKVFVVTTYGSMGAGQNIHYEFDADAEWDLVRTNELSHNRNSKDFDAIYLETPTNILVNTVNGFSVEDDFIKYIYQVKFLQEAGDLKASQAEMRIKEAFKINSGGGNRKTAHPKDSAHFNMAYAKIALQAIGRICRTGNKRRNIHIFYQQSFSERIKPIKLYFNGKLLNPEFTVFLDSCGSCEKGLLVLSSGRVLENKAENTMVQSEKLFDNVIGNWTLNNIAYWEEVRESVLKQPTADDLQSVRFPELYIELPQCNNHYYVNKAIGFTQVSFADGGLNWECVDERYVGLDKIMQIPGLKNYFESAGYATTFRAGKYMLAENVLKRIYQGALGEVAGRCILTRKIFNFTDYKLEPLSQNIYEKFDNKSNDVYFDFKLWMGKFDPSYKSQIKKIRKKMYECKARKVVFVNILKPDDMDVKPYLEGLKDPILVLPYLYDIIKREWNKEGIRKLYEVLEGIDN